MDNKKWYSRYATIFWWTLTILPFVYIMFVFVACVVNYNSLGGQPVTADVIQECFIDSWDTSVINVGLTFGQFSIGTLTTSFADMFQILGISDYTFWGVVVGYMATIQCIHLMFDVIVWLPHLAHSVMERWC